ncbi:MAG: response regulator [Candidatus Omnitrophota bacterium]|jgi:CheY-like chemotaxis protein
MKKKKVLLIDDDKAFVLFAKSSLESTGAFDVTVAAGGPQGIALAQREKPDVILLDRLMPQMSGKVVAESLSEGPGTKQIPVIFLTSMISKEQVKSESIITIDSQDFIAKDIGVQGLINCLTDFFKEKGSCGKINLLT